MVKPYYAVKCNPDMTLMKWLKDEGAGFDCASGTELNLAYRQFPNNSFEENTVFANPCKPPRDIKIAMELKSGPTVVDSCEELEKLREYGWSSGSLIRIAVDDKGSAMPFSRKFGAQLSDLPKLVSAAKATNQQIKGISFHVGSGCYNPLQYSKAIQSALLCLREFPEANIVDIGGGYLADPKHFSVNASYIRESIAAVPPHIPIRWIAEPGRFMATEFQDLFVQVIGKKPALNGEGWRYTIDESLYGQFSCIPFDKVTPSWIRIRMKDKELKRKETKGVLFGRTCDSVDMIAKSNKMEELEVGDWLWFPNMGAYTSVTASEFNGFPKPPVHYMEEHILPYKILMASEAWPQEVSTVTAVTVP